MPKLGRVDQATMQAYEWKELYNLVMMCWCSGYADDVELMHFLIKAREHLIYDVGQTRRTEGVISFIIVMDNVDDEGDGSMRKYGQRVRKESQLKGIFSGAGAIIYRESEPK